MAAGPQVNDTYIVKGEEFPGSEGSQPVRWLFVEDNDINREIAVEFDTYDLILDVQMPVMDGHLAKPIDPDLLYQTLSDKFS